ncbi:PA14 domain-containing protein [Spirosoma validum]|uniref:OmpA family protein n=1 Tax=Spirosoma validum TaxID=2771355 RepID=A0A927B1F3_9BACT|nr:PA14 domain-containing protein [Spirosoma validum]MBD2753497.1 OmpA family protein [Spirosoma validum]
MRTLRMLVLLSLSLIVNGLWAQKSKPATSLEAGLKGEYFNGPNFERKVLTRTDPQVDFNWNWQPPGPGVQREYFSVRWTGKLFAPTSGAYRFSATVDDGVRVWVNGKKVIDEWRKQDDSNFVGEISLNGKQFYDLRIEYYNDWKGSVISVYWESPEDRKLFSFASRPQKTIPAKYLFSKPDRPKTAAAVPVVMRPPVAAKSETIHTLVTPTNRPATSVIKPARIKLTSVQPKQDVTPVSAVRVEPTRASILPEMGMPTSANQPVEHLKPGETVVPRNVVFSQSDYTLLPESCVELNKLVKALQATPALRVEIAGHTDNVGDKRLNMTLSEFRAKVVANYLIRHGISDTRITSKGYGGSRPVTDNISETQRAQNRRVEFTVVE